MSFSQGQFRKGRNSPDVDYCWSSVLDVKGLRGLFVAGCFLVVDDALVIDATLSSLRLDLSANSFFGNAPIYAFQRWYFLEQKRSIVVSPSLIAVSIPIQLHSKSSRSDMVYRAFRLLKGFFFFLNWMCLSVLQLNPLFFFTNEFGFITPITCDRCFAVPVNLVPIGHGDYRENRVGGQSRLPTLPVTVIVCHRWTGLNGPRLSLGCVLIARLFSRSKQTASLCYLSIVNWNNLRFQFAGSPNLSGIFARWTDGPVIDLPPRYRMVQVAWYLCRLIQLRSRFR